MSSTHDKRCSGCGELKPLTEYHACRKHRDGKSYHCKACVSAKGRAWRVANRERKRANNRAWTKANPEKNRASQEKYRKANPEVYRKASAKWWASDPVRARELARARYYADVEHHRALGRRNVNRRRVGGDYVDHRVVIEMHDGVCGICGEDVDPHAICVDHIIPLARGGAHSYANTQPAHPKCNSAKWANASDEDIARGEFRALEGDNDGRDLQEVRWGTSEPPLGEAA